MNCYYIFDEIAGKVLISHCYSMVHSNDIADCTCKTSYRTFEKKEYNLIIKDLQNQIKNLKSANNKLINQIEAMRQRG